MLTIDLEYQPAMRMAEPKSTVRRSNGLREVYVEIGELSGRIYRLVCSGVDQLNRRVAESFGEGLEGAVQEHVNRHRQLPPISKLATLAAGTELLCNVLLHEFERIRMEMDRKKGGR